MTHQIPEPESISRLRNEFYGKNGYGTIKEILAHVEKLTARIAELEAQLKQAAGCMLLPNNGITDTVWFDNHVTLYEHLLGLAGDTDLSGDVEADYKTLTGKDYPKSPQPVDKAGEEWIPWNGEKNTPPVDKNTRIEEIGRAHV